MPSPVFYSVSPFGTGDIKDAANITISGGVATLSAAQTGNIGAGVCIEYNSLKAYIAPNRIGFDSGGTDELLPDTKIAGSTSGATGIVRYVEVTSGSWAGGDAAGWIYFEKTTGTFQDNETINRTKPTSSSNIATINGTIQGNIGNGNTEFVVKTATGGTPSDQSSTSVTSIHHEWASLSDWEAGFIDSNHIGTSDLTSVDVVALACCYYDHADYTQDTTTVDVNFGTTGENNYFHIYTPTGNSESINSQRHEGKYDANKYILYNDSTKVIRVRQPYAVVDGLQIYNSVTDSLLHLRYPIADGSFEIKNCIFRGTENTTPQGISFGNISYTTSYLIFNNLLYDINPTGYSGGIIHGQIDCKIFYNTTYNCRIGYLGDDANVILKNNIANHLNNNYQQYNGTFSTLSDYNISSDSTSTGGANDQTNISLTFTDAANDDFSLSLTDTAAIEQGTDLRSEGVWRDIRGVERDESTPDIGAFEYVSAATGLSLTRDLAWRLQTVKEQSTAWAITTVVDRDLAWRIIDSADADLAWRIVTQVTKDSAWAILTTTEAPTAWRLLTRLGQSTAWKILTAAGLSVNLAWRIIVSLEQDSAWAILTDVSRDLAWRLATSKEQDLAWRLATEIDRDVSWRLKNQVQGVTAWRIFTVDDQDVSWRLLDAVSGDVAWRIVTAAEADVAWAILTDQIPEALKVFAARRRTFIFNARARTFIFLAKEK